MTLTPVVAVIPDDLIPEVLSFLPVNSLLRFQSVCKYWKTLISDPSFVKLHLNNSQTRNPLFTLITIHEGYGYSVVPYSLHRLIENPPFTLSVDPYYHLRNKECNRIVGTCNGLILLSGGFISSIQYFRVWNPATRTISPNFGFLSGYHHPNSPDSSIAFLGDSNRITFCCDESTDTYKIVVTGVRSDRPGKTHVKILNLGDNIWRVIESGPVVPLHSQFNAAVYFCSTLNWLAINGNAVEQIVINSLDLGTETFNQYRLPTGFVVVAHANPVVSVLGGFLCFSYNYKTNDFVIWQMKEFGIEDSWTQFLKISLLNLQIDYDYFSDEEYSDDEEMDLLQLVPLLLSEDADTLVLQSSQESHAILYNWRDNRVERSKITTKGTITDNITRNIICWYLAKVYVESLVSTF